MANSLKAKSQLEDEYNPSCGISYVDWQMERNKVKNKSIEAASELIISDIVIEGYLKRIQLSNNGDYKFKLFQLIPLTVIDLCYRYCREFKDFLILISGKKALKVTQYSWSYSQEDQNPDIGGPYDGSTEIRILSMKHFTNNFAIRLNKLRENITTIKPNKQMNENISSGDCYRAYCFIPNLNINKYIKKEMGLNNANREIHCGIIRVDSRKKKDTLELLHFNSPYYYQYKTGNQKDIYPFYRYKLSVFDDNKMRRNEIYIQNLFYMENNNQLFQFRSSCVDIFDVSNMKWLNDKYKNGAIKLCQSRVRPSVCSFGDRIFVTSGKDVEVLYCSKLSDVNWNIGSETAPLKSVLLKSKMNINRQSHGCDVMTSKGGMIVVGGGGYSYSNAANTIEMYDHHKDIWTLSNAKTIYRYYKAKIWCSGNLIFMTNTSFGHVGLLGNIEYLDIRDNKCKWDQIDYNMEKLFDLYRIKHKWSHFCQGLLI
eukprot:134323_1